MTDITAAGSSAPAELTGPSHEPIVTYPRMYLAALLVLAVIYLVAGTTFAAFGASFTLWESEWNIGYVIYTLGIVHYVTGIRVVDRAYLGGILVLGVPTIEVTGGIVLVPFGIFWLPLYKLEPIEIRVPEDPAKVFRGKKEERWPEGFEEPIRIPFAGAEHKSLSAELQEIISDDDPLLKRATEEISFFVRMVIKQGTGPKEHGFFDFYVRIGRYENARKQVKPAGVAKISEDFTRVSVAEALARLEHYNGRLEQHLGKLVGPWGVDIVTAKITIQLSHSMNLAIEKIPQAQAGAQTRSLEGDGEQAYKTKVGRGDAAATRIGLEEEGEGLKKQATDLGLSGQDVLAAGVAGKIANGQNEKIYIPGPESLVKVAQGIAGMFTNRNGAS